MWGLGSFVIVPWLWRSYLSVLARLFLARLKLASIMFLVFSNWKSKANIKSEWQFVYWNGVAIFVGLCDLCYEGKPVCGPGGWVSGPVDKGDMVNLLALCILLLSLDECPGPFGGFEGIIWKLYKAWRLQIRIPSLLPWSYPILKGIVDGVGSVECILEYCLFWAPLLEAENSGLFATQNVVMCHWTDTTSEYQK